MTRLMTRGQFPELWRVPDFPEAEFYGAVWETFTFAEIRKRFSHLSSGNLAKPPSIEQMFVRAQWPAP